MAPTPPQEREEPPNLRLPSGTILHPQMVRYIRWQLEQGNDPQHVLTHFHDHWHREIAREDIDAVTASHLIHTTQVYPSGYTDIGGARLPTGIYPDVILLVAAGETNRFIDSYSNYRYATRLTDRIINMAIRTYEARGGRLFDEHGGIIVDQEAPGVRPRHTGHRVQSLPATPVTAREGRSRTSFVGTPPPLYSPARPGGHPQQVRAELAPPYAYNYPGSRAEDPLNHRREIVPPYTPPPEYRFLSIEADGESDSSPASSATRTDNSIDSNPDAAGARRNAIAMFTGVQAGDDVPVILTSDNLAPRTRGSQPATTTHAPPVPRRSSLQPPATPWLNHGELPPQQSPPRPHGSPSSRIMLLSNSQLSLDQTPATRSSSSASSGVGSPAWAPTVRIINTPSPLTLRTRPSIPIAPAPAGRRAHPTRFRPVDDRPIPFNIDRSLLQSPGPVLTSTQSITRTIEDSDSSRSDQRRSVHFSDEDEISPFDLNSPTRRYLRRVLPLQAYVEHEEPERRRIQEVLDVNRPTGTPERRLPREQLAADSPEHNNSYIIELDPPVAQAPRGPGPQTSRERIWSRETGPTSTQVSREQAVGRVVLEGLGQLIRNIDRSDMSEAEIGVLGQLCENCMGRFDMAPPADWILAPRPSSGESRRGLIIRLLEPVWSGLLASSLDPVGSMGRAVEEIRIEIMSILGLEDPFTSPEELLHPVTIGIRELFLTIRRSSLTNEQLIMVVEPAARATAGHYCLGEINEGLLDERPSAQEPRSRFVRWALDPLKIALVASKMPRLHIEVLIRRIAEALLVDLGLEPNAFEGSNMEDDSEDEESSEALSLRAQPPAGRLIRREELVVEGLRSAWTTIRLSDLGNDMIDAFLPRLSVRTMEDMDIREPNLVETNTYGSLQGVPLDQLTRDQVILRSLWPVIRGLARTEYLTQNLTRNARQLGSILLRVLELEEQVGPQLFMSPAAPSQTSDFSRYSTPPTSPGAMRRQRLERGLEHLLREVESSDMTEAQIDLLLNDINNFTMEELAEARPAEETQIRLATAADSPTLGWDPNRYGRPELPLGVPPREHRTPSSVGDSSDVLSGARRFSSGQLTDTEPETPNLAAMAQSSPGHVATGMTPTSPMRPTTTTPSEPETPTYMRAIINSPGYLSPGLTPTTSMPPSTMSSELEALAFLRMMTDSPGLISPNLTPMMLTVAEAEDPPHLPGDEESEI